MVGLDSRGLSRIPRYSGRRSIRPSVFRLPDYYRLWSGFPACSAKLRVCNLTAGLDSSPTSSHYPQPTTRPGLTSVRFRLFPFRSPLLGESRCFLFLRVLRWFNSPGLPSCPMYSDRNPKGLPSGVAPFGHPRIKACLRLTEAYRS